MRVVTGRDGGLTRRGKLDRFRGENNVNASLPAARRELLCVELSTQPPEAGGTATDFRERSPVAPEPPGSQVTGSDRAVKCSITDSLIELDGVQLAESEAQPATAAAHSATAGGSLTSPARDRPVTCNCATTQQRASRQTGALRPVCLGGGGVCLRLFVFVFSMGPSARGRERRRT